MLSAPIHRTEGAEYAEEEPETQKAAETAAEESADDAKGRTGFYANNAGVFGGNKAFYPVNLDSAYYGAGYGAMPDTYGGYNNYGSYAAAPDVYSGTFDSFPQRQGPPFESMGVFIPQPSGGYPVNPQMSFGPPPSAPPPQAFLPVVVDNRDTPAPTGYYAMNNVAPSGGYSGGYSAPASDPYSTGYGYAAETASSYSGGYQNGGNGAAAPSNQGFRADSNSYSGYGNMANIGGFQSPMTSSYSQNYGPPSPPVLMYSTATGFMGYV